MKRSFYGVIDGIGAEHLFGVSLLFFVIDNVVNYFIHIPIFVAFGLVLVPFLTFTLYRRGTMCGAGAILSGVLVISAVIGAFRFGLAAKNVSDLLFLLLFVLSWIFYRDSPGISLRSVYYFFVVCTILFSFTFAGFDRFEYSQDRVARRAFDETAKAQGKGREYGSWQRSKEKREVYEKDPMKLGRQWNLSYEVFREYHKGLFRVPHVASYFFALLALFFAGKWYWGGGKLEFVLPTIVSVGCCLYTGSRTIIFAFIGAVLLFLLFSKRWRWMMFAVVIAGLLFLFFLHPLMRLFQNTFLFQYLVTFDTLLSDPGQFSRVKIWMSWWQEIKQFGIADILFGRTPLRGMEANFRNLGTGIWFHNDFLQVMYAYGVGALILFGFFWVSIYRHTIVSFGHNFLHMTFYLMMLLSAIFNGFYFYFPVLLLPLYITMSFKAANVNSV